MARLSPTYIDYDESTVFPNFVSYEPWIYYPDFTQASTPHCEPSRSPAPPVTEQDANGPVPSPEYLDQAAIPTQKLDDCARKLLVLDLNGTLLYRSARTPRSHNKVVNGLPSPPPLPRKVFPRPYLTSFADYIFHPSTLEWLDTMVWSSAQPHNVKDMVNVAFGERQSDLVAVWARDTLGLSSDAYHRKVQTVKDLAKPWSALSPRTTRHEGDHEDIELPEPSSASHLSTLQQVPEHSPLTTILLDDSPLKAQLQPWNHVCIQEYVSEMRRRDLSVLAEYEKGSTDVTQADRKRRKKEKRAQRRSKKAKVDSLLEQNQNPEMPPAEEPSLDKETALGQDDPSEWCEEGGGESSMEEQASRQNKEQVTDVLPMDKTLLAAIGLLETLKTETNVSNWIRSGNLCHPPSFKRLCPSSPLSSPTVSPSLTASEEPTTPSAASSSPVASQPSADLSTSTTSPGDATLPSSSPSTTMWFDNQVVLESWADIGVLALRNLGLPISHGLSLP